MHGMLRALVACVVSLGWNVSSAYSGAYWYDSLHPDLSLRAQALIRVSPWWDDPVVVTRRYCAARRLEAKPCASLLVSLRRRMAALRAYVPQHSKTVIAVSLDWLNPSRWFCCLDVVLDGRTHKLSFPNDPLEAARTVRHFCVARHMLPAACATLGTAVQSKMRAKRLSLREAGRALSHIPLLACTCDDGDNSQDEGDETHSIGRGTTGAGRVGRLLVVARVDDKTKGTQRVRFVFDDWRLALAENENGDDRDRGRVARAKQAAESTLTAFCSQANCEVAGGVAGGTGGALNLVRQCAAPLLRRGCGRSFTAPSSPPAPPGGSDDTAINASMARVRHISLLKRISGAATGTGVAFGRVLLSRHAEDGERNMYAALFDACGGHAVGPDYTDATQPVVHVTHPLNCSSDDFVSFADVMRPLWALPPQDLMPMARPKSNAQLDSAAGLRGRTRSAPVATCTQPAPLVLTLPGDTRRLRLMHLRPPAVALDALATAPSLALFRVLLPRAGETAGTDTGLGSSSAFVPDNAGAQRPIIRAIEHKSRKTSPLGQGVAVAIGAEAEAEAFAQIYGAEEEAEEAALHATSVNACSDDGTCPKHAEDDGNKRGLAPQLSQLRPTPRLSLQALVGSGHASKWIHVASEGQLGSQHVGATPCGQSSWLHIHFAKASSAKTQKVREGGNAGSHIDGSVAAQYWLRLDTMLPLPAWRNLPSGDVTEHANRTGRTGAGGADGGGGGSGSGAADDDALNVGAEPLVQAPLFSAEWTSTPVASALELVMVRSIERASRQESKLSVAASTARSASATSGEDSRGDGAGGEGVLQLQGMSSRKVRHLLNNLCGMLGAEAGDDGGCAYLEVGTYLGSTLLAALWGNGAVLRSAVAIDNFSEFGGGSNEQVLHEHLRIHLAGQGQVRGRLRVINNDCFAVDRAALAAFARGGAAGGARNLPGDEGNGHSGGYTLYLYDGDHSFEAHYRAFEYFDCVLADTFIAVIDDWLQPQWGDDVRRGTRAAFDTLQYEVLHEIVLRGSGGLAVAGAAAATNTMAAAGTGAASDTARHVGASGQDGAASASGTRSSGQADDWWNGMYVAVVRKSRPSTPCPQ